MASVSRDDATSTPEKGPKGAHLVTPDASKVTGDADVVPFPAEVGTVWTDVAPEESAAAGLSRRVVPNDAAVSRKEAQRVTITAAEVPSTASFVNMSASGMTSTADMVMIPGKVVTVFAAGLQDSIVPAHVGAHPQTAGNATATATIVPLNLTLLASPRQLTATPSGGRRSPTRRR